MEEQLIQFETAKLAKEKGFEGYKSKKWYYKDGTILKTNSAKCWNTWPYTQGIRYSAPTQSLLQKWLREEHLIDILIRCCWMIDDEKTYRDYDYKIMTPKETTNFSKDHNSYEECLEKGLYEALKLI